MQILLKPEEWALNLYKNIIDSNNYKISNYIVEEQYNGGFLILHTISWSIYYLSVEEYNNMLTNEILIKNRVVVPTYLDETDIAHQAYKTRMTRKKLPTYEYINSFVILTTTACNARCHYCYEKDLSKKEYMTIDTAEKVVQYIVKKKYPEKNEIRIQWFGGEPLLNKPVIEYIHARIKELNIECKTQIVTNAYLLTDDVVKQLDEWNVDRIQITIDGVNEKYNEIKNYVYSDVDAYLTVINNIHNVLNNSKATISIRLNAGNDNIFNLYDDIMYLKEEFKEHYGKKINFYVAPLFQLVEDDSVVVDGYDEELERLGTITNVTKPERCNEDDLTKGILRRGNINNYCMAFNANAISITPNGTFTPCEHLIEDDILGNIVDDITDTSVIEKWNRFDDIDQIYYCLDSNCSYHPMCAKFYNCASIFVCKSEYRKNKRIEKLKESLVNTKVYYDEQLKKIKGEQ